MKILLIGNGAREHVIGETLLKSRHKPELIVLGKTNNPGLSGLAAEYQTGDLKDFSLISELVARTKPDFAIIGPEDPIAAGVSDHLGELHVPCVAPLKSAARLESSKQFTRDLLGKYDIKGNPAFWVVTSDQKDYEEYFDLLKEGIQKLGGEFVVKADGLKGGKGVKVFGDHFSSIEEGFKFAKECIEEDGSVVIEQKLIGQEFSLMSFSDGKFIADMPPVQDHKRAFEGDKGPNTGGMGSYSCADHLLPFLRKTDLERAHEITDQVRKAIFVETGVEFKGVMYGGFIRTSTGIRLIEYNARFGDPECMNVLPLLKTDFVDVCLAIIHGDLKNLKVEFENQATVCVYLVPAGYPDNSCAGEKITLGEVPAGVKVYYAAVDKRPDGLFLSSSRALAFVGIGDDLEEANQLAQSGLEVVKGPVFYRKDIGSKELIASRVAMMKALSFPTRSGI